MTKLLKPMLETHKPMIVVFKHRVEVQTWVCNFQTENIIGLRFGCRNYNPREKGYYRKRGLSSLRQYLLTRGLGFLGLHGRPMFGLFFLQITLKSLFIIRSFFFFYILRRITTFSERHFRGEA